MIYIQNEIDFLELNDKLLPEDGYPIGTTIEDYNVGMWILLNDDQVAFHNSHPDASPVEVLKMELHIPSLKEAIQEKLDELDEFDRSDEVNSFILNGESTWITEQRRSGMKTSLDSAELLGDNMITFNITGKPFEVSIINAKVMLARIQRYADKSYLATEFHRSAIKELTSVEEVKEYNFKSGYPEKEIFSL